MDRNGRRYLSIATASRLLDRSRTYLYGAVNDGTLPAVKIGGHLRIAADDFERWIADNVEPFEPQVGESERC